MGIRVESAFPDAVEGIRTKFGAASSPGVLQKAAAHYGNHDFRLLVETLSDYAVYILDTDGTVSTWNAGAQRSKGYSAEEAIGLPFSAFYTPEDRASDEPQRVLDAARRSKFETHGWRVRKDGSRFWARAVIDPLYDAGGTHIGFAKVTCDVTAQKVSHDLLTRNLDAALSNMSQGLCLFDSDERLVLLNPQMAQICGFSPSRLALGMDFIDVLGAILDARRSEPPLVLAALYAEHRALIDRPAGGQAVLTLSQTRVLSLVHRPIADGSWVTTIEDISERARSQSQIAHMALHDSLTDLPNRVMFRQRLEDALHRVRRGGSCAVLCLDLDRFKAINDTLGHPIGDGLLIAIADRLRGLVRETDTVARLGGDEFAIIQTDVRQVGDTTILADRVIRALARMHEIQGHLIAGGASIGIALAPNDGSDPDQLLKAADLALYRAKAQGRGRYCYFEPGMDALLQERRLLELELRTALADDRFEIHYQPILDLDSNAVSCFEALLRWHSPRRGLVAPADFITLAEETGLIVEIGAWVLETACREATSWPAPIKVAVNVSVAQFKGFDLVDAVGAALARSGLAPGRLEIEITESILISDSTHACDVLRRIKDLGVSVSMDDFGTGYSSLGYLRSFQFDKIKIDRSFVQGLGAATDCNAIVQAVLGICASLGIVATAEGVETEEQMNLLRSSHCHQAQGYLISRPCQATDIPGLLERYSQCREPGPIAP